MLWLKKRTYDNGKYGIRTYGLGVGRHEQLLVLLNMMTHELFELDQFDIIFTIEKKYQFFNCQVFVITVVHRFPPTSLTFHCLNIFKRSSPIFVYFTRRR